jgi:probable phosphoglycerate mutase
MTTFLFSRHAEDQTPPHTLAGRQRGIHLSEHGRAQADELAKRLAPAPIAAIYSSPMERALETAQAIARPFGFEVEIGDGFNELDYGEWTGRNYDDLRGDPIWTAFNTTRSLARIPSGESIAEVQLRALRETERLREFLPDRLIAIVTHADVIRTVISYCLGLAIDLALRFDIEPASISLIRLDPDAPRILMINGRDIKGILD